jgi:hypothetical protein
VPDIRALRRSIRSELAAAVAMNRQSSTLCVGGEQENRPGKLQLHRARTFPLQARTAPVKNRGQWRNGEIEFGPTSRLSDGDIVPP